MASTPFSCAAHVVTRHVSYTVRTGTVCRSRQGESVFNKDNAVGFLLLALCAVVAAIMVQYIIAGEIPSFSVSRPVGLALGVLFFGLLLYGFLQGPLGRRLTGRQGGEQWPNPGTGERSLWDRLRGR